MKGLCELLALMRLAHATVSVRCYLADIERSRRGLDKAFAAQADALADLRTLEIEPAPEMPAFLLKREAS